MKDSVTSPTAAMYKDSAVVYSPQNINNDIQAVSQTQDLLRKNPQINSKVYVKSENMMAGLTQAPTA